MIFIKKPLMISKKQKLLIKKLIDVTKAKVAEKINNVSNITDFKEKKVTKSITKPKPNVKNSKYVLPPVKLLKLGNSVSTSKKLLQETAKDLNKFIKRTWC